MDRAVNELKESIHRFVTTAGRIDRLDDDEPIFQAGHVSSMFAVQLVMFVESEFAVMLENEDLDLTNFSTVDAIAGLVASKLSSTQA